MNFLLGQRVITGNMIAVVIEPPCDNWREVPDPTRVWLQLPNGLKQWRNLHNVQPLPNGQL
jgi:hypothetical protein